jgi:hypothetical protein
MYKVNGCTHEIIHFDVDILVARIVELFSNCTDRFVSSHEDIINISREDEIITIKLAD